MILVDENLGSRATVEYVFKVLAAAYGAAWDRSLGNAPVEDVVDVWANALDGLTQSPEARKSIQWALNNLPDRCLNSMEFRKLCMQAPLPVVVQLPSPNADPARVSGELSKLALLRSQSVHAGSRDWARRIVARHKAGEKVRKSVLDMALKALPSEVYGAI